MTKIIQLTSIEQQKEDSNDAKSLMYESMIDAAMNDPAIKDKALKLFSVFGKPAFKQLLKILGNDEKRFMIYRDKDSDTVVMHVFKVKDDVDPETEQDSSVITQFSFTEPADKDLFVLEEKDLSDVKTIVEKVKAKFGITGDIGDMF